jgi:hypothetical protein
MTKITVKPTNDNDIQKLVDTFPYSTWFTSRGPMTLLRGNNDLWIRTHDDCFYNVQGQYILKVPLKVMWRDPVKQSEIFISMKPVGEQ